MAILEWVSTFVLALIATMAVNYAVFRRKRYGWSIALAFALYFAASILNLRPGHVPAAVPSALFLLASLVMLWAVIVMVLERPPASPAAATAASTIAAAPPESPPSESSEAPER
jgi:hypothetical protein